MAAQLTKTNGKKNQLDVAARSEEIQKLAYQFFVERGYEHGHDREDWLKAEEAIRARPS